MDFSPARTSTLSPRSAAQRGIWFAQHLAGDVPISIAQFVEIHGNLHCYRSFGPRPGDDGDPVGSRACGVVDDPRKLVPRPQG